MQRTAGPAGTSAGGAGSGTGASVCGVGSSDMGTSQRVRPASVKRGEPVSDLLPVLLGAGRGEDGALDGDGDELDLVAILAQWLGAFAGSLAGRTRGHLGDFLAFQRLCGGL